MCVDALKILGTTAATDYGSSRQRDMGQLWADMTRGYLGEYAFKLFLKQRFNVEVELGHEVGALQTYLPTDIHAITDNQGRSRSANLKVSLKTTKWNGIWLDIPGDQFSHSDVHILINVDTGRDHLFAFFKHLSVFKDKVLKKGMEVCSLTTGEANDLFDKLPNWTPISAYICGFVEQLPQYNTRQYSGKKGRLNYKINSWNGKISSGDLSVIKLEQEVTGKIEFAGIVQFAHDNGYLFNTGNLQWQADEWKCLVSKL